MPPTRSAQKSTVRALSSAFDTSARRPCAPVCRATASICSCVRPVNTTWWPALQARATRAAPMPWLPPVMRKRESGMRHCTEAPGRKSCAPAGRSALKGRLLVRDGAARGPIRFVSSSMCVYAHPVAGRSPSTGSMRLKNILLMGVSFVVAVVLAEGVARQIPILARFDEEPPQIYTADEARGWKLRPNYSQDWRAARFPRGGVRIDIDGDGHRKTPPPAKNGKPFKIL